MAGTPMQLTHPIARAVIKYDEHRRADEDESGERAAAGRSGRCTPDNLIRLATGLKSESHLSRVVLGG